MEINFSNADVILLYGEYRKKISKLESIKNSPSCPIAIENIETDIKLYTSIIDKLKEACPNLSKMDSYNI